MLILIVIKRLMNKVGKMIKILNNGKEKTYRTRCGHCGTDFTYQNEDVKEKEKEDYSYSTLSVKCPVCEKDVYVYLVSVEEWDKQNQNLLNYPSYSCVN